MEEIENIEDACELKIWELIKTERKKNRRIQNRKRRRVRMEIVKTKNQIF